MSSPRGGTGRLVLVLVVTLVAVGAIGTRLLVGGGGETMTVVARFDDASPLLEGNDVRMKGVKVGKIERLTITEDGTDVILELDPAALPIQQDATAIIRPVSLLGERYVELDGGTPEARVMVDGGFIESSNTGSSTDLDSVLNTFDDPTAESLATLVGALGSGMDGNGKNVAAAVAALAPAMQDAEALSSVLRSQNVTLNELVTTMEGVASGLAGGEGKAIDALIASTRDLLETTAVNEAAFRAMLSELPATLSAARRTLSGLESTAEQVVPTLQQLRPTTRALDEISDELLAFTDATDPALAALNPVLAKAQALIDQAQPVAELLRQQGPAMLTDVRALDPITQRLGGDFTTVMEFFKGWALATNSTDGLAHYFRAGLVLTPYSGTGVVPGVESPAPDAPAAPPGPLPGLPELPGLPDVPLVEQLDGVVAGLPGLLANRTDRTGGVTGLSPQQERNALDFLLGGN